MVPTSTYLHNALDAAMNHPWAIARRAERDNHATTQCRSITTRLVGAHGQDYVVDVVFEYWTPNTSVNNDDIVVRTRVNHQTGMAQAVAWHVTHI